MSEEITVRKEMEVKMTIDLLVCIPCGKKLEFDLYASDDYGSQENLQIFVKGHECNE